MNNCVPALYQTNEYFVNTQPNPNEDFNAQAMETVNREIKKDLEMKWETHRDGEIIHLFEWIGADTNPCVIWCVISTQIWCMTNINN